MIGANAWAENSLGTVSFADELFKKTEYKLSVAEYLRIIHYNPDADKDSSISLRLAIAYAAAGEKDRAVSMLDGVIGASKSPDVKQSASLNLVRLYYSQKRFKLALDEGNELFAAHPKETIASQLHPFIVWSYIKSNRWDDAALFEEKIGAADSLVMNLREGKNIPKKSPAIAGVMSAVLPGSGHVYAGKWRDGIMSLIINGVFGYCMYDSFKNGNQSVGWLLTVVEIGWYTGNIYTGAGSARRANNQRVEEYHDKLIKTGVEQPNEIFELP